MQIRKVGAFVATDGCLFEDAMDAKRHSIELGLKNWMQKLDFSHGEAVPIDQIVREIAADSDRVRDLLSIKVA